MPPGGRININFVKINGVEVDITRFDLRKVNETERMAIMKFQNQLAEK